MLIILWLVFESDNYSPSACILGQRMIRAMLLVLPDSRLIEEVNCYLRDLERRNKSNVTSAVAKMTAVMHSKKLESRGVPHNKTTQEEFMALFRSKDMRQAVKPRCLPSKHALPERLSVMMGDKNWESPVQESVLCMLQGCFSRPQRIPPWVPPTAPRFSPRGFPEVPSLVPRRVP